jgi:hypothetical protein
LGACKYCGKSAGFFHSEHAECEEQHRERERLIQAGREQMVAEVLGAIRGSDSFDGLEKKLAEIEQTSFVPSTERRTLLISGWENSVERFLEDGVLEAGEETRLVEFKERFALPQDELDRNGALTKTVKAGVLRQVLSGTIPQRVSFDANLPINFQKGEQIVWAFAGSQYLEDKTRREFVGGSKGVSVRVMSGVYYRVGAFKGHAEEHTERVLVDTGLVVVTDRNIYFAGPKKSLRIPYAKIVSFERFSNGVGLMRDAATAKAQIFVTGDGWFTYNLVTNLSRLRA